MFVLERLGGQVDKVLYYRLMHLPKKQFTDGFCVFLERLLLEVFLFVVLYGKFRIIELFRLEKDL